MKKQKTTALPVPRYLQLLFVVSVFAAVIVTFTQQLMYAVIQFSHNPNLSSFYVTFLVLGAFPLAIFLMAYLLVSRKLGQGQRIFESMLVAVSVFAAQMALYTVVANVFWSMHIADGDLFGSFGLPTLTTAFLLVLTLLYLLRLRRAGRW